MAHICESKMIIFLLLLISPSYGFLDGLYCGLENCYESKCQRNEWSIERFWELQPHRRFSIRSPHHLSQGDMLTCEQRGLEELKELRSNSTAVWQNCLFCLQYFVEGSVHPPTPPRMNWGIERVTVYSHTEL
jgi:hypothetical protein